MRRALMLGLVVCAGCGAARNPAVGKTGMVMAISGVAGIIATATLGANTSHGDEMMLGAEVVSATGIMLYAAHEMSGPEIVYREETPQQRHTRWARVLTEHAAGAARDGNCARVRKWEPRVQIYDSNIHDFVFMRDPEILRCLAPPNIGPSPIDVEPSPE